MAAAAGLVRGHELLDANGTDFSAILQRTAVFLLLQPRTLSLTVRYNPAGTHCRATHCLPCILPACWEGHTV